MLNLERLIRNCKDASPDASLIEAANNTITSNQEFLGQVLSSYNTAVGLIPEENLWMDQAQLCRRRKSSREVELNEEAMQNQERLIRNCEDVFSKLRRQIPRYGHDQLQVFETSLELMQWCGCKSNTNSKAFVSPH